MKPLKIYWIVILTVAAMPLLAQTGTSFTAAATGQYPDGASYAGIELEGLHIATGISVAPEGTAEGSISARLVGVPVLGVQSIVTINGKASAGSRLDGNVVTFSGTSSVDTGDGVPVSGVPFVCTVVTDGTGFGTVGLVLGETDLPAAVMDAGSMTLKDAE